MSNEHEQYIGKKLSECPEGTVALCTTGEEGPLSAFIKCGDTYATAQIIGGEYQAWCHHGSCVDLNTVHHIITLGTPRPKTLADEEPGVAWKDEEGCIWWTPDTGEVACRISPTEGFKADSIGPTRHIHITPNWTRRGKITGLRFEGEE